MSSDFEGSIHAPQKVRDGVAEHGWLCVHIVAEEGAAPYSFTVGLFRTYGHPELILFGLSSEAAHAIFSRVAEHIQNGNHISHGSCPDLIDGFDCEALSVPVEHYQRYVGLCRQYYAGDRFPLLQIVRAGRRP